MKPLGENLKVMKNSVDELKKVEETKVVPAAEEIPVGEIHP